ncbi:hypothetical protein ACPVPU_01010 [Sphingomonas sp. CJ99]
MNSSVGQFGARYWWIVAFMALTIATSWIVALLWFGAMAYFEPLEPLDRVMLVLWGVVTPGWATGQAIWAIAIRRTDRSGSERHFVYALMAVPFVVLGYCILGGWISMP